jgi:hypothetical protein
MLPRAQAMLVCVPIAHRAPPASGAARSALLGICTPSRVGSGPRKAQMTVKADGRLTTQLQSFETRLPAPESGRPVALDLTAESGGNYKELDSCQFNPKETCTLSNCVPKSGASGVSLSA